MKRRTIGCLLLTLFALVGCGDKPEEPELTFEDWRASDSAFDFNEDQRITNEDFVIFNAYETWKAGDDALDMNSDLRITYEDFKIFNDDSNAYSVWLRTNKEDLNHDGVINYSDYVFAKSKLSLIGEYTCCNSEFKNLETFYYVIDGEQPVGVNLKKLVDILLQGHVIITPTYGLEFTHLEELQTEQLLYNNIKTMLDTAKLTIHSPQLIEISINLLDFDVPTLYSFQFSRFGVSENEISNQLPKFDCTFSYEVEGSIISGSFSMIRTMQN